MIPALIVAAVLVAGFVLWNYGPVGYRTYIKGAAVGVLPLILQVLNFLGTLDFTKVFTATDAWWAMSAVGVLIIVFTFLSKRQSNGPAA